MLMRSEVTNEGQRSCEVNLHHPQTAMAVDTSDLGTAMYFSCYQHLKLHLS